MKTTAQTTRNFPSSYRMILYVAALATLGLLNCYMLRASDPVNETDYASRLTAAVEVTLESDIPVETWMLDFSSGNLTANLVEVEDEPAILEDWMLNPTCWVVPEYLIVEKEEEPELEDWMLDPGYFSLETILIANNE